jgi:SAM-dependent methyltransferase
MLTCPLCSSPSISNAGRFSTDPETAAQHFVLAEGDRARHVKLAAHIAALWRNSSCEMMACGVCGLGFAHPFVAGDAEFYNLAYPHSDYPVDKWEFSVTAEALASLTTAGARGLEIGSGFGYFLKQVSPRFFTADCLVAIEYNDVAGRRLTEAGFKLVNQDIRSNAFPDLGFTFDFVFMFQVLEHMDELGALAERLRLVTRKGAHIFMAVPNPERIRFNERSASLCDMPPNHISLWNLEAFKELARRLECEVVDFQTEPMAWRRLISQDLVYAYMQRAQQHGSWANRVRSMPRSGLRRVAEALLALTWLPSRVPYWIKAAKRGKALGGSIWIHLRRQ